MNLAHPKDFLNMQSDLKGQMEAQEVHQSSRNNEYVGFKCLHYSVTESSGKVEITIEKKSDKSEY